MANLANQPKKYPDAPAEIAKLMGFHGKNDEIVSDSQASSEPVQVDNNPGLPADLPIITDPSELTNSMTEQSEPIPGLVNGGAFIPPAKLVLADFAAKEAEAHKAVLESQKLAEAQLPPDQADNNPGTVASLLKAAKSAVPYLAIFAIALGLYYFYFSTFSLDDIFKPKEVVNSVSQKLTTEKATAIDSLKVQEADRYNQWITQFFFAASPEITDMDADVSGNGLSNFQKYLLNLNPKTYDTLGLGMPDGQAILSGINPWTGKALTENQKLIVDQYFDTQLISDRIAAGNVQRLAAANGAYGGVDENGSVVSTTPSGSIDGGSEQNPSAAPYVPISPLGQSQTPAPTANSSNNQSANTTPPPATTPSSNQSNNGRVAGANTSQSRTATGNQRLNNPVSPTTGVVLGSDTEINTKVPARLTISSIGVDVPIIWTAKTADFSADLKKGVVHYPGTAFPGEIGTSYISGHSSGYPWDRSVYKTAFRKLGELKDGSSFTVQATMKSGKKITYHYVVRRHAIYKATDQAQFTNTPDSVVALSTCWPLDSTAERLVVFGYLTQVEQ